MFHSVVQKLEFPQVRCAGAFLARHPLAVRHYHETVVKNFLLQSFFYKNSHMSQKVKAEKVIRQFWTHLKQDILYFRYLTRGIFWGEKVFGGRWGQVLDTHR